ncbi:MAG: MOSC domain-containing protein [Pseudomonadota bacterium]
MNGTIEALTTYPVKGLSGQSLDSVVLSPGCGFPGDRRFGFARPDSGFNPDNPQPLPKTKFYMLARDEKLALLGTSYDDATGVLSMNSNNQSGQFDIHTNAGKQQAAEFLKNYLDLPNTEVPQLFEASPHRFTDVSVVSVEMMNAVSLINLDSVNAFANATGMDVDPERFRGNFHFSGLVPFAELELVGQMLAIGDVHLRVVKRTKRCPATEVNLKTGVRDMKTPKLLLQHYDHMDMGIYAEVVQGGTITIGDDISVL